MILPEATDSLWIEEEDLVEPVTDQFVGVKDAGLALCNVPGDALSGALPIVPLFWRI